jgi:ABC-type branched-subunit amino acid transport system permease subunit
VSTILNLAVGDFAMCGALGVDNLVRVRNWPLPPAIFTTLAVVAVFAYAYDRVVLRLAQDGPRRQEGIVITFFFTFALSFFIDGVAKMLFGSDVHAAPALWNGQSLTVASLNLPRAGLLVLACALIIGGAFWFYIRFTLGGKAMEASGENALGARIVGIDTRRFRMLIFIGTAVIAAVFGIVESPITGYTYLLPVGRDDLADRVPRRRLRRLPQTGSRAAGGAVHRHPRGAAWRVRQRRVRRHGHVRDPGRAGARPAAAAWLRIGGGRMSRTRSLVPTGLVLVAGAIIVLFYGTAYTGSVFVLAVCYSIVTAGMAVQIGFSQQIAFSQSVFMGVGAYGVAMLNTHGNLSVLEATPIVLVASALVALVLGSVVTRASGLALAVATLMLPLIAVGYVSSAGFLGGAVGAPLTGTLRPVRADRRDGQLGRHRLLRLHQLPRRHPGAPGPVHQLQQPVDTRRR